MFLICLVNNIIYGGNEDIFIFVEQGESKEAIHVVRITKYTK